MDGRREAQTNRRTRTYVLYQYTMYVVYARIMQMKSIGRHPCGLGVRCGRRRRGGRRGSREDDTYLTHASHVLGATAVKLHMSKAKNWQVQAVGIS